MNFLIDFDDTIVSSGEAHEHAYKLTFEFYNLSLSSFCYSKFAGRSTHEVLSEFILDKETLKNAVVYKRKIYQSFIDKQHIYIRDGFLDFQSFLKKTSQQWGIVSGGSKASITRICNLFDIKPTFGIISSENYFHSKPNPEPYRTALNLWNLKAHKCIAIEDSINGIMSAEAANIRCLVINQKEPNAFADWKSLQAYLELNLKTK